MLCVLGEEKKTGKCDFMLLLFIIIGGKNEVEKREMDGIDSSGIDGNECIYVSISG